MAQKLDIGGSLMGEVSLKPEEHADDRAARIRREERASRFEEYKNAAVFAVILFGLVVIASVSAYKGLLDPTATIDTQRAALAILTVVVSNSISFVMGRKVGK
jgi:hypothetical protein